MERKIVGQPLGGVKPDAEGRTRPTRCYDAPMQRPARIVVFGILCLVMGAVSGLKNLSEAGVALLGPEVMEQAAEMHERWGASEEMVDSSRAQAEALRTTAYRALLGIESLVTALMAVVVIVAGVGLLLGRLWSLRFAKIWAYYAIVLAVVDVVATARFVFPHTTESAGGSGISMVCMLPMLWLFPVLLITMLSRPAVIQYLRWRSTQEVSSAAASAVQQPPPIVQPPAEPRPPAPRPSAPAAPTTPADPRDTTWRDDPWNDPNSQ